MIPVNNPILAYSVIKPPRNSLVIYRKTSRPLILLLLGERLHSIIMAVGSLGDVFNVAVHRKS